MAGPLVRARRRTTETFLRRDDRYKHGLRYQAVSFILSLYRSIRLPRLLRNVLRCAVRRFWTVSAVSLIHMDELNAPANWTEGYSCCWRPFHS